MSEPTNPLFEEEKEFLERKKLEYERALRGDVEHIKEQTVHVGKLALIGAGVASGIWLLSKAFGRRKRHEWHYAEDQDEADYGFGEADYDQPRDRDSRWDDTDYFDEEPHGYQANEADDSDLDDNGLSEFPGFEPHSSKHHGSTHATDYYEAPAGTPHADVYHTDAPENDEEPVTAEPRRFWSEDYSHPTANAASLPYDDSRRLPESDSFADLTPDEEVTQASPQARQKWLGPAVLNFLQSETGRVVIGQVAAVALAVATKVIQDLMPKTEEPTDAETEKSSDLAPSTMAAGAYPYGQQAPPVDPQSPVLDAKDPDADPSVAPRQPLA